MTACWLLAPAPNGNCPAVAYISTQPREKTSAPGPVSSPRICSGAMNPGEPMTIPVLVSSDSTDTWKARAMPKSMTRGPSAVSRTLEGLRSRWTIPAA